MPKIKSNKTGGTRREGESLIQFRVDESFMHRMLLVADRLKTPAGVLARQWVAERLAEESRVEEGLVKGWLDERWPKIERALRSEMESGPVVLIQIIPLSTGIDIKPERMRELKTLFTANGITDLSFSDRINILGYRTEQSDSRKLKSYTQVFRGGQVESLLVVPFDSTNKRTHLSNVAALMCDSVRSFCLGLMDCKVPLPVQINISLHQLYDFYFFLESSRESDGKIDCNEIGLPTITLTSWKSIENRMSTAELMRPCLELLWNAAGYSGSGAD